MIDNSQVWPQVPEADAGFRFPFGLSVFFPAYNDAPSLPTLVARTFDTLKRVAADYEVIVVDDGSSDNTAEVLKHLQREYYPVLRVITHDQNRGYGGALRSGFAAATKEYIFYTDGDSQYDPAELEQMLRSVTPDTGLVNGYKIERNDPWHRIAIGWLYNQFARWLFRIRLRDIDCDFRLIRRSVLDLAALRSTGGTICVELVRSIELSGSEVVELPVHHYPRRHGRSQFFRLRSLAVTFLQLCAVFIRMVLGRSLRRATPPPSDEKRAVDSPLSPGQVALVLLSVLVLSLIAYAPALTLPFIADDYLQIQLGRDYGPIFRWPALAHDALYRCRVTSLVLTYWIDRAIGLEPIYYNVTSLLLHIANAMLVFALGLWRPVGWRVAGLAACFFAVSQRHSEAVVWFAAVPELLVFFFGLASFLCFVQWLQSGGRSGVFYGAAFGSYLLALLSKESAVAIVPLAAVAVFVHPGRPLRKLWSLLPFSVVAVGYFLLAFAARETHLHFSDGTFSLSASFIEVLVRSTGRMIWFWGVVFLPILAMKDQRAWRTVVVIAGAWIVIGLLPYSFLTYMPRVPSRHTYLASVGKALIVAVGLLALQWREPTGWRKRWLFPVTAVLIVVHQCGYLWTVKQRQYSQRAEPTEQLIRVGRESAGPIYASCFPYSPVIAEFALRLRIGGPATPLLIVGPDASQRPDALNFCNEDANGVHY